MKLRSVADVNRPGLKRLILEVGGIEQEESAVWEDGRDGQETKVESKKG